jgi:serine/threonine protein kinase
MQTIGDNKHVLGCIEAFRDQEYMYIVMPFCDEESLVEWIPWKQGLPENQAKQLFLQILENILYLRSHGICHRDLSPDNCMVYKGRVVLTDLAMSFRIPPSGFVVPLGAFGKPAYLPPEVFFNLPFDAYACDVWSSAVILFNLLTGEILYQHPAPNNILFRYFILARGLSNTPVNERTVEILMEVDDADRCSLQNIAEKCMTLSPNVLTLLEGILRVAFQNRWTIEDIKQSAWIQNS